MKKLANIISTIVFIVSVGITIGFVICAMRSYGDAAALNNSAMDLCDLIRWGAYKIQGFHYIENALKSLLIAGISIISYSITGYYCNEEES